jgi:TPR repeat protein
VATDGQGLEFKMKRVFTAAALGLSLLVASGGAGFAQGLSKGQAALKKGAYAEALREFQPLAKQGNAVAQYALGVMYLEGQGVTQDYKEAVDTYNPATHQANIRDKRKEFARIITTKTTSPQAKEDAQKQFKKTNYVFKRKSNAGRPPNQPSKQTAY